LSLEIPKIYSNVALPAETPPTPAQTGHITYLVLIVY